MARGLSVQPLFVVLGFTMSLFVATLAFPPGVTQEMSKIGIFIGSIISGLLVL